MPLCEVSARTKTGTPDTENAAVGMVTKYLQNLNMFNETIIGNVGYQHVRNFHTGWMKYEPRIKGRLGLHVPYIYSYGENALVTYYI